jgi:hypothetical protein
MPTKSKEIFGGKYTLYSDGRLYSHKLEKFLKPTKDTSGYYYWNLAVGRKIYQHQLVQKYFGDGSSGKEVAHKDNNKTNNKSSNLTKKSDKGNAHHRGGPKKSKTKK